MSAELAWTYKIEYSNEGLKTLSLIRNNTPFSTFYAKPDTNGVRNTMWYLFDISKAISEDLPDYELYDFLCAINNISYELGLIIKK